MANPMVNTYDEHGELVYREMTAEELAAFDALQAQETARVATAKASTANAETLRGRADAAIATLEQAIGGWAGLTAAQKDGAIKLSIRVVISLSRLVLQRLDSAGV